MSEIKTIEERIKECMNIRIQIRSLGLETIDYIKEKLSKHMNDFIARGESQTFTLKIPDSKDNIKVMLICNIKKQSGIHLLSN